MARTVTITMDVQCDTTQEYLDALVELEGWTPADGKFALATINGVEGDKHITTVTEPTVP